MPKETNFGWVDLTHQQVDSAQPEMHKMNTKHPKLPMANPLTPKLPFHEWKMGKNKPHENQKQDSMTSLRKPTFLEKSWKQPT